MIYRYTRTGDRHIRRGAFCDDALAAVQYGDCAAMFLADGCSSSLFGGDAARRITERLADMVRYPRSVLRTDVPITPGDLIRFFVHPDNNEAGTCLLFREIEKEVRAMRALYRCEANQLCCTLIAAFARYHPDSGKNSAAVLAVGDGFVAAGDRESGRIVLVSKGENIDDHPNRTYFCTSQNAIEHVRAYYVNNFDELLLSSDGVTHTVDIECPDELTRLMRQIALAADITDTRFSKGMDRLLSAFMRVDPYTRDLEDDCGVVYYSTDKKTLKQAVKNKHFSGGG